MITPYHIMSFITLNKVGLRLAIALIEAASFLFFFKIKRYSGQQEKAPQKNKHKKKPHIPVRLF